MRNGSNSRRSLAFALFLTAFARAEEVPRSERVLAIETGDYREATQADLVLAACERASLDGRCVLVAPGKAQLGAVARVVEIDAARTLVVVEIPGVGARREELVFSEADSIEERARALGLALGVLAFDPAPAPSSAADEPDVPPAAPERPRAEPPSEVDDVPPRAPRRAEPRREWLFLAGPLFGADVGLGGVEAGGFLRARAGVLPMPIFFRAGVDLLTGAMRPAPLELVRVHPTLGVGSHWLARPLEIDFGVDAGVEWFEIASPARGRSARVLPLVRATTTFLFELGSSFRLGPGASLATVFSPTDLYVDDVLVSRTDAVAWSLFFACAYRR